MLNQVERLTPPVLTDGEGSQRRYSRPRGLRVPAGGAVTEKSRVDQAEKAMSLFVQSASQSVGMLPGPMTEMAKQALALTEVNLKASFDHAPNFIRARDINDYAAPVRILARPILVCH